MISGISGPSAYSIPIESIPKCEGRRRRNHQNSSSQIPKKSGTHIEANSACTQHELEWARGIHPQWRSHQRQQHSWLGEWCSETSKGISPTWMARICPGPSPRQCALRLDWKPQTLGLDASRISHIRCFFHSRREQSRKETESSPIQNPSSMQQCVKEDDQARTNKSKEGNKVGISLINCPSLIIHSISSCGNERASCLPLIMTSKVLEASEAFKHWQRKPKGSKTN